jgi:hypothetical protein
MDFDSNNIYVSRKYIPTFSLLEKMDVKDSSHAYPRGNHVPTFLFFGGDEC